MKIFVMKMYEDHCEDCSSPNEVAEKYIPDGFWSCISIYDNSGHLITTMDSHHTCEECARSFVYGYSKNAKESIDDVVYLDGVYFNGEEYVAPIWIDKYSCEKLEKLFEISKW